MLIAMRMVPVMLLAIAAAVAPLVVAMRQDVAWRESAALAVVPSARSASPAAQRSSVARTAEPWHRR